MKGLSILTGGEIAVGTCYVFSLFGRGLVSHIQD